MDTHPMNTNMTGFRWFKYLCVLVLWTKLVLYLIPKLFLMSTLSPYVTWQEDLQACMVKKASSKLFCIHH